MSGCLACSFPYQPWSPLWFPPVLICSMACCGALLLIPDLQAPSSCSPHSTAGPALLQASLSTSFLDNSSC